MMKYTRYSHTLPREHRNTPWAENDPDFNMSKIEKVFWIVFGMSLVGIVSINPFGWAWL